ncbi:MAG: hypothetical protein J0M13_10915 [Candidatus Accumulibacter sp.]|nr:hypothetical protein [Candidatus Accumulibacter necessarius]
MTTGEALDLITSVLSAVKRLLLDNRGEVTDADLIALERRIRRQWAGCRPYVGGRVPVSRRYQAILADLAAGIPESDVAETHEVSARTIRRARQSGQRRP